MKQPVFHRVFIWHLIGEEDSYLENGLSCPIMCQMKVLMKSLMQTRLSLSQAKRVSASREPCQGWINPGRSDECKAKVKCSPEGRG